MTAASWRGLWTGLIVVLAASAGCAGPSPPDGGSNAIQRTVSLPAHEFFEANLEMNESADVTYEWSTEGTSIAFDVHSHANQEVRYYHRSNGSSGQGSFQAPSQGAYSLLWENASDAPVNLTLAIEGDFQVRSYAP